ncbi:uncharacterized protein LOC113852019 [Abrus precatorius]|uniref:Uncharacterized protein LOC113852019 n=1 Tax=Abrus precatorius TaxID=3816 RepID=A0A8B8K344_ABRPR|nr:uncharacterized protein LOC113852019 [Abrus precatorius]
MGNCASNPKTNEDEVPVPEPMPVTEEVKVEQQENKAEDFPEAKIEDSPLPVSSDDNSLATLLNENGEKKEEQGEVKEESKTEEVKAEGVKEEKVVTEEAKPETKEEKPTA